ncbi:MAG: SMC-Scp complex subunit ScpB [Rhodothermaceae bacterium]|nr:SMC-Scp complex subunit ScpB [Rhodothermaceae bacterium]
MHTEISAKAIVESLIFSHPEPLGAGQIAETIMAREDGFELTPGEVDEIVAELNREYQDTGRCFSVIQIGGGYTFATRREFHPWLQFLQHENASRKMSQELVDVAGRNDSPGRPLLYQTNSTFLKHFGINSIDELPKPREIEEILQDDDMAQHRQLILELKAELVSNAGNGSAAGNGAATT